MEQEKKTEIYPQLPDQTYQTGRTTPPKNHGGIIALLLGIVILLCGLVSALSFWNIRLFWELAAPERKASSEIALSFTRDSAPDAVTPVPAETLPEQTKPWADLVLETMPTAPQPVPVESLPPAEEIPVTETVPVAEEFPYAEVAEKINASMARVEAEFEDKTESYTGFAITQNGYLLVNGEKLKDARQLRVYLPDLRCLEATFIGKEERSGMSVLHVSATDLTPVSFCNTDSLREGDLLATFPGGNVSRLSVKLPNILQTELPGTPGEPLVNRYGQVVGVSVAVLPELSNTMGFAISSIAMEEAVESVIRAYVPEEKPSLGLIAEAIPLFYQLYYELPNGFYITGVDNASDAFLKGISIGDILISINGQPLSDITDLKQLLQQFSPGETVSLVVYRSGEHYELSITLGEE